MWMMSLKLFEMFSYTVFVKMQLAVKRFMDVMLSAFLIVIASPLMLAAAVAIRCDSKGPIFFRQVRVGQFGRPFVVWKFRTMRVGAEKEWRPPASSAALATFHFQGADDPRITRIGRLLRRMSLDELPQLFNVLTGQMSLVGPRPEVPEIVALYSPEMHARHSMRPGITGLAQVSGRGDLSTAQAISLDLKYCQTFSLCLDLKILARTVRIVWRREGAH